MLRGVMLSGIMLSGLTLIIIILVVIMLSVVRNPFGALTQLQQEQSHVKKGLALFQILVTWVIISDWPRLASWQHFYIRGLPTKKLQATVPTSLSTSHTLQIFIQSCLSFKRTGACGKSWSHYLSIRRPNIRQTSSKHLDNSFHIPPLLWNAKHQIVVSITLPG